ncbi:unnamed protein product [Amoebophrya sp. A25]|nr:unnamed protein product [Amoebophrya sp. A25]|eukprot:GSA25T00001738001.1
MPTLKKKPVSKKPVAKSAAMMKKAVAKATPAMKQVAKKASQGTRGNPRPSAKVMASKSSSSSAPSARGRAGSMGSNASSKAAVKATSPGSAMKKQTTTTMKASASSSSSSSSGGAAKASSFSSSGKNAVKASAAGSAAASSTTQVPPMKRAKKGGEEKHVGTKLLPPLADCWWDPGSKNWVAPQSKEDLDDVQLVEVVKDRTWVIQLVPSSRSTCRRCGEFIEKGLYRVGYPVKDRRGDYWALSHWLHLGCASYSFYQDPSLCVTLYDDKKKAITKELCTKEMVNFEDFGTAEKNRIVAELQPKLEEVEDELEEIDAGPKPTMTVEGLTVPLLKFQQEGLHWLVDRENEPGTRGGILADEMGMGKTIQMISVILKQRKSPTLVVCPTAAVLQWRNEIHRFTNEIEVRVYHGGARNSLLDFTAADNGKIIVVITTYQTMEYDYRQIVNEHKIACEYCGKRFLPEKLAFHQTYFCGPDAMLTEAQQKTARKEEAVKHMKIGGKESDIIFDPVKALRKAMMTENKQKWADLRSGKAKKPDASDEDDNAPPSSSSSSAKAKPKAKSGAGRKLMIGGYETNIEFAPVKEDGKGGGKRGGKKAMPYLPFPYTALPEEAQSKLLEDENEEEEEEVQQTTAAMKKVTGKAKAKAISSASSSSKAQVLDESAMAEQVTNMFDKLKRKKGGAAKTSDGTASASTAAGSASTSSSSSEDKSGGSIDLTAANPLSATAFSMKRGGPSSSSVTDLSKMTKAQIAKAKAAAKATSAAVIKGTDTLDLTGTGKLPSNSPAMKKRKQEDAKIVLSEAEQAGGVTVARIMKARAHYVPLIQKRIDANEGLVFGPGKEFSLRQLQYALQEYRAATAPIEILSQQDEVEKKAEEVPPSSPKNKKAKTVQIFEEQTAPVSPHKKNARHKDDELLKPAPTPSRSQKGEQESESKSGKGSKMATAKNKKAAEEPAPKTKPCCGRKLSKAEQEAIDNATADTIDGARLLCVPVENDGPVDDTLDFTKSPLFSTVFERVILDEAHRIKTRTTSTCQAAFALQANTRWCVSGTPLQNRVGELYSLARFIRLKPFAYMFCEKKDCNCCLLDFKFGQDYMCEHCGHGKSQHRNYFQKHITLPLQKYGNNVGLGKKAMNLLKNEVLAKSVLRRTKEERKADLNLPSLTIMVRRDQMSASEKDFYQSMYMQTTTEFNTYVDKGTLLHNYAHVFDLIMRLRQAVDHPYLIIHGMGRIGQANIPSKSNKLEDGSEVCVLCQDMCTSPVIAKCGHAFHRDCVKEYIQDAPELESGGVGCPCCFAPLTVDLGASEDGPDGSSPEEESSAGEESSDDEGGPSSKNEHDKKGAAVGGDKKVVAKRTRAKSFIDQINVNNFESSTKIEALIAEINSIPADSKALVFSQFIRFLELIEFRLKRECIPCAKLTGSQSIQQRNNIISDFHTNPIGSKVLLVSLKAGGEGLNLQRANYIYVMDPWWNPAAELQAMQRAHRIGQTKPVVAKRFILKDTIEEKILELQQKKQAVFDATVGKANHAWGKLSAEDLKYLFTQ